MLFILPFFKKSFQAILIVFIAAIFLTSCKKTVDMTYEQPYTPDLSTKVNSSVSGFVTNENNAPVIGAIVEFGAASMLTDKYGFFEFDNILVTQTAAVLTVKRAGYFTGIRTFEAEVNKPVFVRVKLLPKAIIGTVNGSVGGTVRTGTGLSISFPAAATVNANTGTAYTGTITVKAAYINPTATDLSMIMPGDLRGLKTDGRMEALITYGMVNVEMSGSGGELLQMANGKKATMTAIIPSEQLGNAPDIMPLWHFNESNGLWIEEGSATKIGNTYVGDVSHFSFWNYDISNSFVQFNCTIVSSSGVPIPFALVRITANGFDYRDAYTNADGYFNGVVPANLSLQLEVFDNNNCPNSIYTQNFTTTNIPVSLGTITLPTNSRIVTLTGNVKNCSNGNVTNGKIIISDGFNLISYPFNNGTYSIYKIVCAYPTTLSIVGEDITAGEQSQTMSYTINSPGLNNVPDITACAVATQQYFTYTDNGNTISFMYPTDTFGYYLSGTSATSVYANRIPSGSGLGSSITYAYSYPETTVGSVMAISSFYSIYTTNSGLMPGDLGTLTITEYGSVGQFVSAEFTVVRMDRQTSVVHNISGSFRIRRSM